MFRWSYRVIWGGGAASDGVEMGRRARAQAELGRGKNVKRARGFF